MSIESRRKSAAAVRQARSFEEEQEAIRHACVVDFLPIDSSAWGIYYHWLYEGVGGLSDAEIDERVRNRGAQDEDWTDFVAICKALGTPEAGHLEFYVETPQGLRRARVALEAGGFTVALHPSAALADNERDAVVPAAGLLASRSLVYETQDDNYKDRVFGNLVAQGFSRELV